MMAENSRDIYTSPDIETLERWLRTDLEIEQFTREFYQTHGRSFNDSEFPSDYMRLYPLFPTDISHAFPQRTKSLKAFSTSLGKNYAENQFFLPGLDIFINKHPKFSDSNIHSHQFFEICYVYSGSCSNLFYLNDGTFSVSLKQGDFLFIPPGRTHKISVLSDSIILNIEVRQSTFQEAFSHNLPSDSFL